MMELINPIISSACFLIGLLLVGAVRNRRRGWKKQREVYSSAEMISPLWEYFEQPAMQPVSRVVVPRATAADAAEFSLQLTRMTEGLRGKSKPVEIGVEEAVAAIKSVRTSH